MDPIVTTILVAFFSKLSQNAAEDMYKLIKDRFHNSLGIDPLECYRIVSKHSKKCLDVGGDRTDDGAGIILWEWKERDNQKWHLLPIIDGYWMIISRSSQKCLDVAGAAVYNGTSIIQWSIRMGENQLWKLIPIPGGYYKIAAKHSGKYLDVAGKGTKNGTAIIQWQDTKKTNQHWKLIKA